MRHYNSVFHDLLKHVPWSVFEGLVQKHGADFRVRRLSSKSQFVALLFGQLAGAVSLREIEAGLSSHAARLYHLGATCPARSTLADANARRPSELYAELFAYMVNRAGRATRRQIGDGVRILDATRIALSSLTAGWLDTVKGHRAVKLHIAYDPAHALPMRACLSDQRLNDIVPARDMPITPGMTYVFDLAYYDFAWWHRLDQHGCRFVTRLKSHTQLGMVQDQGPTGDPTILYDRIGLLPPRLRSGRNHYSDPVREIGVRIATGKQIRLLTNDLDAPAQEIADLYKERWQIELFFKWLKQNLRIARFLGQSENAIRIQIFIALIAYLLLRAAHQAQTAIQAQTSFAKLVRLNIMQRRSINQLRKPPDRPQPSNNKQMMLQLWEN